MKSAEMDRASERYGLYQNTFFVVIDISFLQHHQTQRISRTVSNTLSHKVRTKN